jgi:predicted MFS family arabinose efflux permease
MGMSEKYEPGIAGSPLTAAWGSVISLAVGVFATVSTEFLPIGLLTNIAQSLEVSEGTAGLMVTLPGLIAALAGPGLLVLSGQRDRRTVLLILSGLLVISNVVSMLAPNLFVMLMARLVLGACVGGFWTLAPSAISHLVPSGLQVKAMSYVLAGISVATVLGVPATAFVGNLWGWRSAFGVTAAIAALIFIIQSAVLPPMPASRAFALADVFQATKGRAARIGILVTMLIVAGHFAAYTYFKPILLRIFGLESETVAALLLAYGAAGFVGTIVGGSLTARSVRGTALLAAVLIALMLLLSELDVEGLGFGIGVAIVWGIAFGLVPVSLTAWMVEAVPNAREAGQALLVTAFQLAIALGALAGGFAVNGIGLEGALVLGSSLTGLAALIIWTCA